MPGFLRSHDSILANLDSSATGYNRSRINNLIPIFLSESMIGGGSEAALR
jgi:hypothetical protein